MVLSKYKTRALQRRLDCNSAGIEIIFFKQYQAATLDHTFFGVRVCLIQTKPW